ncbi:hypothetical protein VNO80_23051 [Phaseolus coccineus]|uniref:Uncharacterized protein n=1 Tax=Phaseolus coccineus TaxID=3886 RepID=A0AAN9MB08_PHACN
MNATTFVVPSFVLKSALSMIRVSRFKPFSILHVSFFKRLVMSSLDDSSKVLLNSASSEHTHIASGGVRDQLRRQAAMRKKSGFELTRTGNSVSHIDVVPPKIVVLLMNPKKRGRPIKPSQQRTETGSSSQAPLMLGQQL